MRYLMYVCLCAGISDTTIKQAIHAGCHTLKAIKEVTGAMSQCCGCCGCCKEILQAVLEEKNLNTDVPNERI